MDHKKFIKIELITWIVLAGLLIVILVLSILNKSKMNDYEFRSSLKVENFSYNIDTVSYTHQTLPTIYTV